MYIAVYEIDLAEKTKLDRIEGLGSGYNETTISVPDYGECRTYIADDQAINESLQPIDWYKEMVLLGCRYHEFPAVYLSRIEAVQAYADIDEQRSREEWKLIEALRNGT